MSVLPSLVVNIFFAITLFVYYRLRQRKRNFIVELYCRDDSKKKVENVIQKRPHLPPLYTAFDWHGQLQTITQFMLRTITYRLKLFLSSTHVKYDRELLPLSDGGLIALDWAYRNGSISSADNTDLCSANLVLIHHGLGGGSSSDYIVHLVERLLEAKFVVVVVVARGCGGLEITTPSFVTRKTDDIREALVQAKKRLTNGQVHRWRGNVFMVGFSLGAALSLKYLCEEGKKQTVQAAVCVSPPWKMDQPTRVYGAWSKGIMLLLKAYIYKHRRLLNGTNTTIGDVLAAGSIEDLNTIFSEAYGYANLAEYYADNSPVNFVHDIHTPTLAISSLDDPVCCGYASPSYKSSAPGEVGPGLCVVRTTGGGHCSFPDGYLPMKSSWTDGIIVDWFKCHIAE